MSVKKSEVSRKKERRNPEHIPIHDLMEMSGSSSNRNAYVPGRRDMAFNREGATSPLSGYFYPHGSGIES